MSAFVLEHVFKIQGPETGWLCFHKEITNCGSLRGLSFWTCPCRGEDYTVFRKTKQNGEVSKIGTRAAGITGECPNIPGFVHGLVQNHFNLKQQIAEHRKPHVQGPLFSFNHSQLAGCCAIEGFWFSGDTGRVNQWEKQPRGRLILGLGQSRQWLGWSISCRLGAQLDNPKSISSWMLMVNFCKLCWFGLDPRC